MKVTKKSARISHQNSPTCVAYEYNMNESAINGAVIELSGRYPETGRVVNTTCTELLYVISGMGEASTADEQVALSLGDQLLIQPNEAYYIEGNLELYIACTPAWSPDQHMTVE